MQRPRLVARVRFRPSARLNAERGDGVRSPAGRWLFTPSAGGTLSEGAVRASRPGTRGGLDATFSLSLEGTCRKRADTVPEHRVLLHGVVLGEPTFLCKTRHPWGKIVGLWSDA